MKYFLILLTAVVACAEMTSIRVPVKYRGKDYWVITELKRGTLPEAEHGCIGDHYTGTRVVREAKTMAVVGGLVHVVYGSRPCKHSTNLVEQVQEAISDEFIKNYRNK